MGKLVKKIVTFFLILTFIFNNILSNYFIKINSAYAADNQMAINIDGITEDWSNTQPISQDNGLLTSLSAIQDNDKLYMLIRGSNLNTLSNFYIDSDNDSSTGFHSWAWQSSGVDYMIENGLLYSYTGTGTEWSWANTGTITIYKNDTVIEASVDLSLLGKEIAGDLKLAFCRNGADYLPNIGSPMATVNNPSSSIAPIEYEKEESKSAGIVNQNGVITLDTKYKQPNKFNIYYGELVYSGIADYSDYDFLVVYDRNVESVTKVRSQGCKIFQYLYFGSRFENTDIFITNFKEQILDLRNKGLADGIFFDECDVEYWELGYSNQTDKCQLFYNRLKEITDYCRSIGIQTVVNGSRAFCDLGDYYLWESFQGYWTTNSLTWKSTTRERQVSSSGEISYGLSLSDWTLSGSCYYDGESICGGSNGSAEILLNMDDILQSGDRKEIYDWIYFEWFGQGADDSNCDIWVWTGDELPFSENTWDSTWRKLPKLWKGEPESWDGIGKSSKYVKIKMVFNGADNLKMDSILLTYNYQYPNWNMSASNGQADTNPYMWNYNNFQRDYLWQKMNDSGNKVKILTHSYGNSDDDERKMYTYLSSAIWGFYSCDYVHPLMQNIYENNQVDDPIGMLLRRDSNYDTVGYFTNAMAGVGTTDQTYFLNRIYEPSYWHNQAAIIDGDTNEWTSSDNVYNNSEQTYGPFSQWWGAYPSTYDNGTFNNVQVAHRNGFTILELIEDGTGTWVSPVIKAGTKDSRSMMEQITWDGSGSLYYWKYKSLDGSWTNWEFVNRSSNPNVEFTEFQVKVEISGIASYIETLLVLPDENGNLQPLETFIQGESFWGSSHTWDLCLDENINVQNFAIKDDNKYIYFSFSVEGQIDFSQNPNLPSNFNYNIFINSKDDMYKGYIGTWWKTNIGTNYRISNNGIFEWDDSYSDRTDSNGWKWIGAPGMTYKLSGDKKTIEYRIKKDSLGGLEARDLHVYMQVEDCKSSIGNLINPIVNGQTDFTGYFTYRQKSYKMNTPHGWYCSDEKDIAVTNGYLYLAWSENEPDSTSVQAWIRTRQDNTNWGEWTEVHNGEPIYGTFSKAQYCFGLYTSNGEISPVVSDIVLDSYLTTDNLSILTTGVKKLTYTNFPLTIIKDRNPITVSITGPNDYSKTETYNTENTYVSIMQCFTYPGEYTIAVNGSNTETVSKISVELSKFDEAYQMLEIIKHYEYGMVIAADSGDEELYYESKQNASYIMYALLDNSIVQKDAYVYKYLATRLLDGDVLNISDVHNIKNSLIESDYDANHYFTEWEQKREDERDSLAISMIPYIGSIKGFFDAIEGYDIKTGRKLAWWERAIGFVSIGLDVYSVGKLADIAMQETRATSTLLRLEVIAGKISQAAADAIEMGYLLKTISRLDEALAIIKSISFSELDDTAINIMLKNIDDGILSVADKVDVKAALTVKAMSEGVVLPDLQIVRDASFVDANTGNIKWPPEDGFTLKEGGSAIKDEINPQIGKIIDRYGNSDGRFVSPKINGESVDYAKRSLPYLENPAAYHEYEVGRNFIELPNAIDNCQNTTLKNDILNYMNKYHLTLDDLKTFEGEIAPAFYEIGGGGGTQWQLPLPIKYLEQLGFIHEL